MEARNPSTPASADSPANEFSLQDDLFGEGEEEGATVAAVPVTAPAPSAATDAFSLESDPFEEFPPEEEEPLLPASAPAAARTEPLGFHDDDDKPRPRAPRRPRQRLEDLEGAPSPGFLTRLRMVLAEERGTKAPAEAILDPAEPDAAKLAGRHLRRAKPAVTQTAIEPEIEQTTVMPELPEVEPEVEQPAVELPPLVAEAPVLAPAPVEPGFVARLRAAIAEARATQAPVPTKQQAGLDVSSPSRRRAADRAETVIAPAEEDEFLALVTPLSPSELRRLREEVAAEEDLFSVAERMQTVETRRYGRGLAVGLTLLALLGFTSGRRYLHTLMNATAPGFLNRLSSLSHLLGVDAARAVYVGLGFLAPFLLLAAATDAVVSGTRALRDRSLPEAMLAVAAAAFTATEAGFLLAVRPLPVFVLAAAWIAVRTVTNALLRRRS